MRQANDRNREELNHLFRLESLQKQPPERIQQKRLRLITCNIEGIKSNSAYINSLNMENTILCLQEHFLWDFQKNEMNKLVPNIGNYTICHDTKDPLNGFKLPRGQAGVAILWPQEWDGRIKRLKLGNERIIAITVASSPEICLINAYLPTQNTNSQVEYSECLDVIFDIIVKYQSQYQIKLCGDLNGTVMESRNNKHDQLLKKFITEMGFDISKQVSDLPTFFHHAYDSTSQIDYIFAMEPDTIVKYKYGEKSYLSSSAHIIVKAETNIKIPMVESRKPSNNQSKLIVLWEKMDRTAYNDILEANLNNNLQEQGDIDQQIKMITDALIDAQKKTIPNKITQLRGPKWKASSPVEELLKKCKILYTSWCKIGKPKNHNLHKQLKTEKKELT
jgi:hypothetical protein